MIANVVHCRSLPTTGKAHSLVRLQRSLQAALPFKDFGKPGQLSTLLGCSLAVADTPMR